MSALDQAFIKAYAKELPRGSAAADGGAEDAAPAPALAVAEKPAARPVEHLVRSQIENIYAEGILYRIEIPMAAEPELVPPPHYAPRSSRRLTMRDRLQDLATQASPTQPRPGSPASRRIRPRGLPAGITAKEPTQGIVTAKPLRDVLIVDIPPLSLVPLTPSVEVRGKWDELLGSSSLVNESALVVWPDQEDFAQAHSSSLIALDLETMPDISPLSSGEDWGGGMPGQDFPSSVPLAERADHGTKTFRVDNAHAAVPEPHQPEPKIQDRPPAISDEEAAVLVGAEVPPAVAASALHVPRPLIPAWEVDHFVWPALCEKLLRDEQSYFAQAGGKIASAVRDGLRALAITGSRRGEGRTTLALCLARSAAKAGLKVALVDADFTRPQLAAVLGLETAGSWHDSALRKTPLAEVAIKSLEDNFVVLPLDVSTVAIPLSLADARLTATLREARGAFDLLVLDMGPISAGEGPLFPAGEAPPADAVIVVRDLRYCTPAESQAIGERLSASGIEAVGIAENFVPQEKMAA